MWLRVVVPAVSTHMAVCVSSPTVGLFLVVQHARRLNARPYIRRGSPLPVVVLVPAVLVVASGPSYVHAGQPRASIGSLRRRWWLCT